MIFLELLAAGLVLAAVLFFVLVLILFWIGMEFFTIH